MIYILNQRIFLLAANYDQDGQAPPFWLDAASELPIAMVKFEVTNSAWLEVTSIVPTLQPAIDPESPPEFVPSPNVTVP